MKALPPLPPPPPPLPLLLPPATTKAPAYTDGKALFPPLLERERGGGKRRRGSKVSSTYSVYLYTTDRRGQRRRRRIDGGGGSVISVTRRGGRNPLAVLLQPPLSPSPGEVVPAHTKQGVTSLTSVALGHGDKAVVVVEEDFHPLSVLPKNLQSELEVEARRMVLEGYSWSPPVSDDTSLSHILDAKL